MIDVMDYEWIVYLLGAIITILFLIIIFSYPSDKSIVKGITDMFNKYRQNAKENDKK